MIYVVVKYGNAVLEKTAKPIEEFDEELAKLCQDMFESMYAANGVGLAAPQVGIAKRLAVIDVTVGKNPEAKIVLANPEIIHAEGEQREEEGCLSVPGFRGNVARPQYVSVAAVKEVAADAAVRIYQPETMKSEEAHDFYAQVKPDAVVIIAYGQIIPRRLLDIPRLGWMNLHASLLPKYRGAAPIAWAIINGENKTGLTTMRLDPGLDTGPILMQREIAIGSDETAPELAKRRAELGAPLVVESLIRLERGEIRPMPQESTQ